MSFAKSMKNHTDQQSQRSGSVAGLNPVGLGEIEMALLVESPQRTSPLTPTGLLKVLQNSARVEGGGSRRYLELLDEMKELHLRKNAGYAGDSPDPWANFRMSESFGVSSFLGVLVRMSDKWIRITNLVNNPKNEKVGESIKDTLFDLAAYALIAIAILEEVDTND